VQLFGFGLGLTLVLMSIILVAVTVTMPVMLFARSSSASCNRRYATDFLLWQDPEVCCLACMRVNPRTMREMG
jgi:hypothetical protein